MHMVMEFAVCKSGVKDIKILKDRAKALGRAKGVALHKSLDIIAAEEGFEGGWHDLVISKWSLSSDKTLHKVNLQKQIALKVTFPGLHNEDELEGASGISGYISREMDGKKLVDIVHLEAIHEGRGLTTDAASLDLLDKISKEPGFRLRCILAITVAERALRELETGTGLNVITSIQRRLADVRRSNGISTSKTIHQGVFERPQPPLACEAIPSNKPAHVSIAYIMGDTEGVIDIPRDQWIALMAETIEAQGDPRSDRDACLSLLAKAGIDIQHARRNDSEGLEGP
jgi:hypothetical protein